MRSHHPPADALPGGRPQDHLWATLVLVAGVAAYLPALAGAFIWNDADYVTSPALRSWAGLARIWTEFGATEQYYPLLHSAFWLQHRFWGDHAFGYHLINVLAHAGGAVLFGVVLRQLAVPGAWLGAALFALHPVHVESVAWISEQKNTLSLLLYLAAAWAYLKFDDTRSRKFYALGLALFALSLLTKTVTATLPAALLVVLWWRRGTLAWRRDFRPLLPWLLLGAGAGLLTSWIERHYGGAVGDEFTVGWPERLLVAGRAFWFYVGSLVWPFNLNFIYPRWTPDARVVWQWLFPLAAVAVIAIGWLLRHRTRAPLAVLLFFAGSLFPVLGFVILYGARYSWVWDHWQYLPDLGPLAFAGAGLALAARRFAPHARIVRFATVALLASLAALTWSHSRIFRDDETLYRATLARNPDAWMAHANLGTLIGAQPERRDEAIRHLRAAAELKPDSAEVHESLANLLAHNPADHTAAREHYEIAIRLEPARATAHNNFGLLLSRRGETEAALACFRRALEHNPRLAFAAANLGSVLCATDRAAEALPVLEHALALDPALPATHLALGNTFRALSRHADAERAYREALRLDPAAVDIRLRLAELLLATEELPAAVTLLRETAAIV
ncbi:MAG TPA: tetratricopeptide repeat protein, partial [Opitutus sp.]|nr:tetratricopeptide repeat protein [Opitutus sp.]